MNDVPPWISVTAWVICLSATAPAIWRIFTRRARYLDPIWLAVFLLALNRLSFVFKLSALISHVTAAALAIVMAIVATSYQCSDKKGGHNGTGRS